MRKYLYILFTSVVILLNFTIIVKDFDFLQSEGICLKNTHYTALNKEKNKPKGAFLEIKSLNSCEEIFLDEEVSDFCLREDEIYFKDIFSPTIVHIDFYNISNLHFGVTTPIYILFGSFELYG